MNNEITENNERSSANVSVRPSPMLFWIKTKLVADRNSISGSVPNTIFGWIPTGKREIMSPMKQIAGISVDQSLEKKQILLGLLLGGMGIFGGTGFGLSLILLVIAASFVLSSIRVSLVITNTGGVKESITVSFLDKSALLGFIKDARVYMIER